MAGFSQLEQKDSLSSPSCHQEDTNNRVSDSDIHDPNSEYPEIE